MNIKLKFKVERRLGDPTIRILVDEQMSSFDGPCPDEIELDLAVAPGDHELRIIHYGKQHCHHEYDEQGNVVVDRHVEIVGIEFDHIKLFDDELREGEFFPVYHPDYVVTAKDNNIELPYSIRPNLYLGHNGTWRLHYRKPPVELLIYKRKNMLPPTSPEWQSSERTLEIVKEYFKNAPELNWSNVRQQKLPL